MSSYYSAIAQEINELQRYIVKFYQIDMQSFSIKIVPGSNVAFTKINKDDENVIYISLDNIKKRHILGHEITHAQVPIKNCFLAEGFASLITYKLAGNFNPFWFPETTMLDILAKHLNLYTPFEKLIEEKDLFYDFSKISTRYFHIIAASFIEWNINTTANFTRSILEEIKLGSEKSFINKYKTMLPHLEKKWLNFTGLHLR